MAHPSQIEINSIAFVFTAITVFIMVFIPVFLTEQGLTGLEIGFLIGLGLITSIFAAIPIGIISDRFSTRISFAVSLFLVAAFFVYLNFASGFIAFIPLFIMLGIGKEAIGRFLEITTLKIETGKVGKKFGVFTLFRNVGAATGALAGGIAITSVAFALTFNFAALLMLLLLIPVYFLKEIPKVKVNLFQYGKDFAQIKNILFAGLLFLFAFHWGAEATSYGLFLKNYLGLNPFLSGAYLSISIGFLAVFAFIAGRLIDNKTDHRKLFILGIFLSGLGHILMVNPNVFISLFWRIVHEAGDGLFIVTQLVWISLLFKRTRIGGNYGIMFTIMALGSFTGAIVSGPLGEATNYGIPLALSGAILVAEAIILTLYLSRHKIKNRKTGFPQ
jgi:MFS family permease